MTFNILVVGSKDWEDVDTILDALEEYAWMEDEVTLIHGARQTGADSIAEERAWALGWNVESHPAEWGVYGSLAGEMRDAEMIANGADICLAFIKDHSRDATKAVQLARQAGIRTIVYTAIGDVNEGKFVYCQEALTFGQTYLRCDKEASDQHTEHRGIGTDDEGKLYMMSWNERVKRG